MGWEEEKEEVVVDEVGPVELSVRTGETHGRVVDTEIQTTFEAALS